MDTLRFLIGGKYILKERDLKMTLEDNCSAEIDIFIEKFWKVINEEYDYRDMLTFEEIKGIFDRIKKGV